MTRFIHISSYERYRQSRTEWLNVSLIQSVYAEIEGGSFGGLTTIVMLGGFGPKGTDIVRTIRTKETPDSFFQRMNKLI